ncbi:type I-B CRISPR-associated protein Cas8b1/Cst1 [Clostridium carnis]
MGSIRVESGDWLKNASIVGLLEVLENMSDKSESVVIKNNYIEFDSSILNNFEEEYFKILINKNEKNLSWYKLISYEKDINNFDKNNFTDKELDKLNKIIDDLKSKSKLNSNSYKSAYLLLDDSDFIINKEKELAKIKLNKKDNIEDYMTKIFRQIDLIREIINYFNKPEVKRVVAAKNIMYDVIQPFWNNISFLLSTKSKGNMYELYKDDFINPVLNYMDKETSKFKYSCFTCNNKISKLSKPEAFDLTWLVKTGADMSRKSSHFWNMSGDAYICPICNLLYSCLPLGFVVLKGKGIFINSNRNIKMLKQSNTIKINYKESLQEIEQLSYLNILNSMEQQSIENIDSEFENIQVIKIDGNNERRPYSFNILSPKMMKVLYFNRKTLNKLIKIRVKITEKYYLNLYDEVIRRIYDGKNLFDLIHQLLVMYLDNEKFKRIDCIYGIIKINNSIIGGINMKFEDIEKFTGYGYDLRKEYEKKNVLGKLPGITYRLINALKTKDSSKFMEVIINSYMYVNAKIPMDLGNVRINNDILQGIGYEFLIGLQGEKNIRKKYEDNKIQSENNEVGREEKK